jgi:tetratricopeptide (TPR) repeat protein
MTKTEITTTVNGHVENLVSVAQVNGNFINNGIIYLTASFEVFKRLNDSDLTDKEFIEFANSYYEKLKLNFGSLNIIGFDSSVTFDNFFIEPLLNLVTDPQSFNNNKTLDFNSSILSAIKSSPRIFIQGPAGSGKTTLLKYILANVIDLKIKAIPIFVPLMDFKAFCSSDPSYTLYDYILKDLITYGFPRKFVHFFLKNGLALLLMDGFDEMYIRENEKRILFNQLEDFKKLYDAKIIITSRNKDYDFSNSSYKYFEIASFNNSQIDRFLNKQFNEKQKLNFLDKLDDFYNFTYENRNQTNNPDKDWVNDRIVTMARHGLESTGVHEVILKEKPLPQIATNPLFLSLLVLQFKEDKTLSINRSHLYENLIQRMIDKWFRSDAREFFKNRINRGDAYKLLCYIAFYLFRTGETVITRNYLFTLISRFLMENNFENNVAADDILKTIRSDLGLITDYNGEEFKFIHQNVQEYLIAKYLTQEDNYNIIFFEKLYLEKNWSQVLLLSTELLSNNDNYRLEYAKVITNIICTSSKVGGMISSAIDKSKLQDGEICYGFVFYYLCIGLYYNTGERAIYACQRLAHEVLFRVYNKFKDDPIIAIKTFCQELMYVARILNFRELNVDAIILHLYDQYIDRRNIYTDVKELMIDLKKLDFHEFEYELSSLKSEIENKNNEQSTYIINQLLERRNLKINDTLDVTEINLLTLFLDVFETYLEASSEFGKSNDAYSIFFNKNTNETPIDVLQIPDFLTSDDYSRLSNRYYKTDKRLSLEYISNAIKLNPVNATYYFVRGCAYSLYGYNEKSLHDFLSAENLNEDYSQDAQFQRCFGVAYKRMNEYEKAIERFDKAIMLGAPKDISDRWFKVEILMKTHEYEKAIRILTELKKINPSNDHFFYCLAYCSMMLGDFTQAVNYIKTAIQHRYFLTESYFIMCYCKLQLHRPKEVSKVLRRYIPQEVKGNEILNPLLLKSYKMQGDDTNYKDVLKQLSNQNFALKNKDIISVPISPGHIELQQFNDTYFTENFFLPTSYFY